MIFDITMCRRDLAVSRIRDNSLELGEDGLEWLSNHICQHVKPSSMWHTDYCLLAPSFSEDIDHCLHTWNKRLTTFKTKSLHRVEFNPNKL